MHIDLQPESIMSKCQFQESCILLFNLTARRRDHLSSISYTSCENEDKYSYDYWKLGIRTNRGMVRKHSEGNSPVAGVVTGCHLSVSAVDPGGQAGAWVPEMRRHSLDLSHTRIL